MACVAASFPPVRIDNSPISSRMRPDGSDVTRLPIMPTADCFAHLTPAGKATVRLACPPGTRGHPADLWVDLKVVHGGDWAGAVIAARFFGGQRRTTSTDCRPTLPGMPLWPILCMAIHTPGPECNNRTLT